MIDFAHRTDAGRVVRSLVLRRTLASFALPSVVVTALLPATALATPRDDMKAAHAKAIAQFNELDLEGAQLTLDLAINQAKNGGMAADPGLAPLLALYAGVLFSNSGDKARSLSVFQDAVKADYHVSLPIELRSQELQAILDEARASVSAPSSPITHSPPATSPGSDLEFEALIGAPMEGGQAALYWRRQGDPEFQSVSMDLFGNLATATVPASEHLDQNVEYFIYAFDANNQPVAGTGDQDSPLLVRGARGGSAKKKKKGDEGDEEDEPKKKKKKKVDTLLPRVFINIGLGTGFGVAGKKTKAEGTLQMFDPENTLYGLREQACAFGRWANGGPAPDLNRFSQFVTPGSNNFVPGGPNNPGWTSSGGAMVDPWPAGPQDGTPATESEIIGAYDPGYCGQSQPIAGGLASAPFHLAPEIGFRIGKRIVLSLYGRLQLVTGSKVRTADPNKGLEQSFVQDVYNAGVEGVAVKHAFTWAAGVKLRYFLLGDMNKFRLFVGGFAGGGFARLRVDMGISDDKNGNSVPDNHERAFQDVDGNCVPVWPYHDGCGGTNQAADIAVADGIRANAGGNRIDTVRLGPGFVGALFGFHYQAHKNFAIYGELGIGGWFAKSTSVLFDLTVGPAITF